MKWPGCTQGCLTSGCPTLCGSAQRNCLSNELECARRGIWPFLWGWVSGTEGTEPVWLSAGSCALQRSVPLRCWLHGVAYCWRAFSLSTRCACDIQILF